MPLIIVDEHIEPLPNLVSGDVMVIHAGASISDNGTLSGATFAVNGPAVDGVLVQVFGSVIGGAGIRLINGQNTIFVEAGGYVGAYGSAGRAIVLEGELINDGRIYSRTGSAVEFDGTFSAGRLTNTGIIQADSAVAAVQRSFSSGGATLINSGTIRGAETSYNAATGSLATDTLTNTGTMIGSVFLGGGDDVFTSSGRLIGDQVELGDGNDIFTSTGFLVDLNPASAFDIDGGDGDDTITTGAGRQDITGGDGADRMAGGAGDDEYEVDGAGDRIIETVNGGIDDVQIEAIAAFNFLTPANVENVDIDTSTAVNVTGNALANEIEGGSGANRVSGLGGNDTIEGGDGNDRLTGGLGADTLEGEDNADHFIYNAVAESRAGSGIDMILDFTRAEADKIVLSAIDANITRAGNQAFSFIGSAAFSGNAGELRFQKIGTDTHLTADLNGDRRADMTIVSDLAINFIKADFVL